MRHTKRLTSLLMLSMLTLSVLSSCAKRETNNQAEKLHMIFDEYWEFQLASSPTMATSLGDKRFDSLLNDITPAGREKHHIATQNFLNRLKAIDRATLNDTDKASSDILDIELSRSLEGEKFKNYTMPISQQNGPQLFLANLIQNITWQTEQDYENYLKRMRAFPDYINQTIENMREGIELGLVSAKVNIEPVIPQIESFVVKKVTRSPFYQPIKDNTADLPEETIERLSNSYKVVIQESVIPAFIKLKLFLRDEYLPVCREDFGVWSLPDGKERYAYLIKFHTTLPLTPEEITATGMKELGRIDKEMHAIMDRVGWDKSLAEFFDFLHTDKQFYYTDKDSLLAGYRRILDSVKLKVPEIFGILPKADCVVDEMPAYQAKTAPTAYYNPPAEDGSRPGRFTANTYNLKARPKYEMEALTYHEAIPGHHLQIATQQELKGLPAFRNHSWFTAYGEGWALYSERLPKEIGFYQDPYSDFGRLIYDAWRACRLVVDCGLHYYKWDRQKAIDFMKERFGGTDLNIQSEVDRYIAWPGQALGYKIGQLKILELRQKAKDALGDKFKLSDFHDQILNQGSLPLPALEKKIDEWIGAVQ